MLFKTRRLIAVAATAVALSAVLPGGTAAGAPAPCRASSASTGSEVAVVLEGHYVDSQGGDVTLTCYLVQNGVKVASAGEDAPGPVAVVASDERIPVGTFRVCHSVTIWRYVDWGYYSDSNC